MGVHYPFGYRYETAFLHTFIELLDNFCSGCHTNKDVNKNCRLCPVGQLIYASKDYLLRAYEPAKAEMSPAAIKRKAIFRYIKQETQLIRAIKKEVRKINPKPHLNSNWIWDKKRSKDMLLPLRELLKDLEFYHDWRIRSYSYPPVWNKR